MSYGGLSETIRTLTSSPQLINHCLLALVSNSHVLVLCAVERHPHKWGVITMEIIASITTRNGVCLSVCAHSNMQA